MSLCLASAGVVKTLTLAAFTLAWTHSIEKDRRGRRTGASPRKASNWSQARIKGFGAGMEPPPDARLVDGWFQWQVTRPPQPKLLLGNSGAAGEWRLCADGTCRTLSEIVGHELGASPTIMSSCE